MLSAIIIDDEKNAIITLRNDLTMYCPEVAVSAVFVKPLEAIDYLQTARVDIIFLDIEMPVMNGFDFIGKLGQPLKSHIIFTTAFNEFAIKAFRVSALDYLLKPVVPAELKDAVQKVVSRKKMGEQDMLIRNLLDQQHAGSSPKKIALPVSDGYHIIDTTHIIYCRAKGAYTEIIMNNDKNLLVSRTLGKIEELLPPEQFERIHQSFLVNLEFVRRYRKGESPVVVMSNSDILKVSRANKEKMGLRLGI